MGKANYCEDRLTYSVELTADVFTASICAGNSLLISDSITCNNRKHSFVFCDKGLIISLSPDNNACFLIPR